MLRLGLSPHQQDGYFQNLLSEAEDAVLDIQFKCTNSTDTREMRKQTGIRKGQKLFIITGVHQRAVTKHQTLNKSCP